MYWETGDQVKSQGWTPLIVDTNGNGKRDEGYNEPGKPGDPGKDTRIPFGMYGISWSPLDGTLWGSNLAIRATWSVSIRDQTRPKPRWRNSIEFPCPDTASAAWTSIATASSGRPRQRPHRELRPPQVQRAAQRTGRGTRQQMSRRLDLLSNSRPRLPGRSRRRRESVLRMGRSARHPRARRRHADRHRQPVRFAARPGGRSRHRASRPLSDGLFRQGARWPHR